MQTPEHDADTIFTLLTYNLSLKLRLDRDTACRPEFGSLMVWHGDDGQVESLTRPGYYQSLTEVMVRQVAESLTGPGVRAQPR